MHISVKHKFLGIFYYLNTSTVVLVNLLYLFRRNIQRIVILLIKALLSFFYIIEQIWGLSTVYDNLLFI